MGTNTINLASSLFSKARLRVLGLLFNKPETDFYTNEIIRLTKVGRGVVQRELENLTAVGILSVTKRGNQKHYQANSRSPLYHELYSLLQKTVGVTHVLQDALMSMENKIDCAFIYGSYAKGEDKGDSDIDIMIIGKGLTYADFFENIQDSESKLDRKINPTFYAPSEWIKKVNKKNHFITKIIQQPKIFIVVTENDLKNLK